MYNLSFSYYLLCYYLEFLILEMNSSVYFKGFKGTLNSFVHFAIYFSCWSSEYVFVSVLFIPILNLVFPSILQPFFMILTVFVSLIYSVHYTVISILSHCSYSGLLDFRCSKLCFLIWLVLLHRFTFVPLRTIDPVHGFTFVLLRTMKLSEMPFSFSICD